jgi:predicted ATPase/DNA-binding CsgD family transcriptional regulator
MLPKRLPTSATSFVGRSRELAEIATLLSDPTCRLLTLVGPGGIGKTRLALEVARQLPTDSARFVELQPLTSPDFLVSAIAEALGFQFYKGNNPKRQLLDYLCEQTWLLVLDNFEHLLDGASLLSEILIAAPAIRLLVTSRERLNLVEEWVLDVRGLTYPPDDDASTFQNFNFSALDLFVQHARHASVGFTLTDANRPAVIRICHLVDGMPLGIELAASRVRVLSCEAIAAAIERSLDILETPARNVEPRHRTMRAAFELTWNRLSESERSVFTKLSIFRGGFTREAAEAVAGASLRTLSALVDKSLLLVNENSRYDLHELLRQYAAEKLNEAGKVATTVRRHVAYFLQFAEQVEAHNFGREQVFWYDRAEVELDNLRAVLACSADTETGLRIATALGWFFWERTHLSEGLDWLQKSFAANPHAPVSLRAKALNSAAGLTAHLGGDERTQPLIEQALALARAANDRWNIAWALSHLAMMVETDPGRSAGFMDESLALFRELNDAMGVTHSLIRRAWVALDQEDYRSVRALADEAAIYARKAGDQIMSGWVSYVRGQLAWYQSGDHRQAHIHFVESLSLFRKARKRVGINTGLIFLSAGEMEATTEYAQMLNEVVLTWLREIAPTHPKLSSVLTGLASITRANGQPQRAAILLGAASRSAFPAQRELTEINIFENEWAAIRAELCESAFAEAWAAGSAMTSGEAIAYALENDAVLADTKTAQPRQAIRRSLVNPLSNRELDVLRLIAEGHSNQEIADRLYVGVSTVKKHINHIYDKLDVKNRMQAVPVARSRGLLT